MFNRILIRVLLVSKTVSSPYLVSPICQQLDFVAENIHLNLVDL